MMFGNISRDTSSSETPVKNILDVKQEFNDTEHPKIPSAEVLAKRLNAYAGSIVLVSSIALIVFLTNISSEDYRVDFEALKTLSELKDISVSTGDSRFGFNKWLANEEHELLKECNEARSFIVNALSDFGVNKESILRSIEANPEDFSFVDLVRSKFETEFMIRDGGTYKIKMNSARNVAELMDRFESIYAARRFGIVRSIKLPLNKPRIVSELRDSKNNETRQVEVRFFAVHDSNKVDAIISLTLSPFDRAPIQELITFPAEIVEVDGLSLAAAMDLVTPSGSKLYADGEHRIRLRKIYGNLDVANAMSITSEQFVRSYKHVEILGMSFSAKNVAFAVCIILLILTICLSVTVRHAVVLKHKVISEVSGESQIELIIDWLPTRVIGLGILPIAAVWGSLPPFPLGFANYLILGFGTTAILFFAVVSIVSMRQL